MNRQQWEQSLWAPEEKQSMDRTCWSLCIKLQRTYICPNGLMEPQVLRQLTHEGISLHKGRPERLGEVAVLPTHKGMSRSYNNREKKQREHSMKEFLLSTKSKCKCIEANEFWQCFKEPTQNAQWAQENKTLTEREFQQRWSFWPTTKKFWDWRIQQRTENFPSAIQQHTWPSKRNSSLKVECLNLLRKRVKTHTEL